MASSRGKKLRVNIKPKLLQWTRKRAGYTSDFMAKKFPKYSYWERGMAQPTLKQLERMAKTLHVPLGIFFLDEPPREDLPIPDLRTMPQARLSRPSPELLETIYSCQQRQEWYRNYLLSLGEGPIPYVGKAMLNDSPKAIAAQILEAVNFDLEDRRKLHTWTQALGRFIDKVEQIGILVMVNSIVGNNTHRHLNPEEFRGFALIDDYAPVIFINGADTIAAKTFTLAHELAHIWLGRSGISDARIERLPEDYTERWCNQVAAEVLVPQDRLADSYNPQYELKMEVDRLAREFKVSTLVILRRLFDGGHIDLGTFRQVYEEELERVLAFERKAKGKGGGAFFRALGTRVSKRFAVSIIASALEGQTLFRDAYAMLGISKAKTFRKLAGELGINR